MENKSSSFEPVASILFQPDKIEEIRGPTGERAKNGEFRQLACRLGLTDAGLIFVAATKAGVLITDDRPLFQTYSAGRSHEIRLLDEYLQD